VRIQTVLNTTIVMGALMLTVVLSQTQTAFASGLGDDGGITFCGSHIYQQGPYIVVCDENFDGIAVRKCYYENNDGQPGKGLYCVFPNENRGSGGGHGRG
jgi:hypothetical protein